MTEMQQYSSEILYHFVGGGSPENDERNFDTLCKVLSSQEVRHRKVGSRGHPFTIEIDYERHILDGELIVQSVVCFCDIPLAQLQHVHAGKYGRFGVGVDKLSFARQGGRPVIYMPLDTEPGAGAGNCLGKELLNAHRALTTHFCEHEAETTARSVGDCPRTPAEAASLAASLLSRDVLAFLKYYNPRLLETDPCNYYMEREWRKFGNFGLHSSLRKIVVARGYRSRLLEAFPYLSGKIDEQ